MTRVAESAPQTDMLSACVICITVENISTISTDIESRAGLLAIAELLVDVPMKHPSLANDRLYGSRYQVVIC